MLTPFLDQLFDEAALAPRAKTEAGQHRFIATGRRPHQSHARTRETFGLHAEIAEPTARQSVAPAPVRKRVVWNDQEKTRTLILKQQGVTYRKIAIQLTEELGRPVTKSHIVNLFNRDLKHAVLNAVEASLGASSEAVEPTTKAKVLEVPTRENARPEPAQSDKAPGDVGYAGKVEDEEGSYKQSENKPGDEGDQKIKKVESADFVKLYASLVHEVWKVLETREMEEARELEEERK